MLERRENSLRELQIAVNRELDREVDGCVCCYRQCQQLILRLIRCNLAILHFNVVALKLFFFNLIFNYNTNNVQRVLKVAVHLGYGT
jgi:hypothetical protein